MSMTEERLLSVNDDFLYVLKRIPAQNIATKSIGRFFAARIPETQAEQVAQKDKGLVKSCTELARLFKVDVIPRGNKATFGLSAAEVDLILSFVNKAKDPKQAPEIKRYTLRTD